MPADAPLLLLRADAGLGIGSGHASRLLSLAESWIDAGGRARMFTFAPSAALKARAGVLGVELAELPAAHPDRADQEAVLRAVTSAPKGSWIAVDGYRFDAPYLTALRAAGARVLRVDDAPRGQVPCDAFLDPNPGAETSSPSVPPQALALLGTRWALLRSSFSRAAKKRGSSGASRRVLISFGGEDPVDATGLALRALRRAKTPFEAAVVVGPDNPRAASLAKLAEGLPVRIERAADMPALMRDSDVGLICGGTTMLEACAAGLASLVVTVAANQEPGTAALAERGLVRSLGPAQGLDEERLAAALESLLSNADERERLSSAGRAALDGKGAARVAAALLALSEPRLTGEWVRLRPAAADDALDVWRIANDPSVRARSFRKEPIPLPVHLNWFQKQLEDPDVRYWLVEVGRVVAGQVRYTREGDEAEVHYSVLSSFRGKGLGTLALAESRSLACRELGVKRLTGFVIEPNLPSERSFVSAGWTRRGTVQRDGAACAVYEAACS
jgi:UDP-2,4-diacetamido-2,4,6-trideoxy-beta-L-altropyranose hydrolase